MAETELRERAKKILLQRFEGMTDELGLFLRISVDGFLTDREGKKWKLSELMADFAAIIRQATINKCAEVAERELVGTYPQVRKLVVAKIRSLQEKG